MRSTFKRLILFALSFQNLLFYYDNEASERPAGIILLEGCYCQKQISTDKGKQISDKQVSKRPALSRVVVCGKQPTQQFKKSKENKLNFSMRNHFFLLILEITYAPYVPLQK